MDAAFCPRCGRLMADELGPLCDHCDPPLLNFAVLESPSFQASVTWSLIAVTTLASVLAFSFMRDPFPRGAIFGPSVAKGHWWLLLTAMFVHYGWAHWLDNMIGLWFLGKRFERITGHWAFLAFYLVCGITGNIFQLVASPEGRAAGASGAIYGISGGLIVYYALRWRELTRSQWLKLSALTVFTASTTWADRLKPEIGTADHAGGLVAGCVLSLVLSLGLRHSVALRRWAFSIAAVLLAGATISFRLSHPYLVHLDVAARALQAGDSDLAARELHTALAMMPDSSLAQFLIGKLDQKEGSADSSCAPPSATSPPGELLDPCATQQCDRQTHTYAGPGGSTISYSWSRFVSDANSINGIRKQKITEVLLVRAVDSFNQPICAHGWMRATETAPSKQRSGARQPAFSQPDFSNVPWQPILHGSFNQNSNSN